PIIIVNATRGETKRDIIARFEKRFPTTAEWESLFSSPVKKDLISALGRNRLVLLVFQGKDPGINASLLEAALKGRNMVLKMNEKDCAIVTVDLDNPVEKHLINNAFCSQESKPRPGILVLFGKGKGLYFIDKPAQYQVILDAAVMLDKTTNTGSSELLPRLLLDMPKPSFSTQPQ
ncbi:MAG: hypothetical protein V1913_11390, partial [Fibrobacterota bacterium]